MPKTVHAKNAHAKGKSASSKLKIFRREKGAQMHTFFSALSSALDAETGGWSAEQVHKKILLHFCSIMFENGHLYKSINHVIENSDILTLQKTCILHPAIKLWIAKIHSVEPHLHKQAKDWLKAYPKLLKGMALRFVYFHRNYAKKPQRLFCGKVFAQLACEAFCCHIRLNDQWFYPLETADYFLKLDLPIVILTGGGGGVFELHPNTDIEPLILPQLELIKE